jgi:hypothetical protein
MARKMEVYGIKSLFFGQNQAPIRQKWEKVDA